MALMLDTRFIQKNMAAVGNTCTIIEIARSTGSDEYRTISETETSQTSLSCFVQILTEEDESVKEGKARMGDFIFWFDSANESYCVQGNRITFDSKTFQIKDVRKFDAMGNTTYLIQCFTSQV